MVRESSRSRRAPEASLGPRRDRPPVVFARRAGGEPAAGCRPLFMGPVTCRLVGGLGGSYERRGLTARRRGQAARELLVAATRTPSTAAGGASGEHSTGSPLATAAANPKSAFASCGHAAALALGSNVPKGDIHQTDPTLLSGHKRCSLTHGRRRSLSELRRNTPVVSHLAPALRALRVRLRGPQKPWRRT